VSVKIRLRVVGKKKQHSYRIIAIESRNPRDGKYLEQLGWYNPHSKELQIDGDGIKKWQDKGAILTDAVKALMKRWDVNASKETEESEVTKASKETEESEVTKASKETEESKVTKASKEPKKSKVTKASKEPKKSKETEQSKEVDESKETEEVTDVEGTDNIHSKVTGGSA